MKGSGEGRQMENSVTDFIRTMIIDCMGNVSKLTEKEMASPWKEKEIHGWARGTLYTCFVDKLGKANGSTHSFRK